MDWIARLKQEAKGRIHPSPGSDDLDRMQREYFHLLARFWSSATEDLPLAETRHLLDRIDEMYQELHQAGRKVPVRLPVERNREHDRGRVAL